MSLFLTIIQHHHCGEMLVIDFFVFFIIATTWHNILCTLFLSLQNKKCCGKNFFLSIRLTDLNKRRSIAWIWSSIIDWMIVCSLRVFTDAKLTAENYNFVVCQCWKSKRVIHWFDIWGQRGGMAKQKKSYSFRRNLWHNKTIHTHNVNAWFDGWQMRRLFSTLMRNKSAQPRISIGIISCHSKAHWLYVPCFGPFIPFSRVIWIYFISINNVRLKYQNADHTRKQPPKKKLQQQRRLRRRRWR